MFDAFAERPQWQRGVKRRLQASTTIAAMMMVAFVGLVQFADDAHSIPEIEVSLVPPDPVRPDDGLEPLQPIEIPQPLVRDESFDAPVPESPGENIEPEQTDWYAQIPDLARDVVTSRQSPVSVNPVFDAKRREAAAKFAPSRAPAKKPIWENVHTDQLGRKLLVSGDCYRVIDETRVTQIEAFETFYQYITFCSNPKPKPRELPWVDEVRQRLAYL